jgi:hypothetical protein
MRDAEKEEQINRGPVWNLKSACGIESLRIEGGKGITE